MQTSLRGHTPGSLRMPIESTVSSPKRPFPAARLPGRGHFRVAPVALASAELANVWRIQRYSGIGIPHRCLLRRPQLRALDKLERLIDNTRPKVQSSQSDLSVPPCRAVRAPMWTKAETQSADIIGSACRDLARWRHSFQT